MFATFWSRPKRGLRPFGFDQAHTDYGDPEAGNQCGYPRGGAMARAAGVENNTGQWRGAASWLQLSDNSAGRGAGSWCGQRADILVAAAAGNGTASRWPFVAFTRALRADMRLWLLAGH